MEIDKLALATYHLAHLPCYPISEFKWCNPDLARAIERMAGASIVYPPPCTLYF